MPNFSFTARQASGQIQKGTIAAHDRAAAITSLRSKQLQPIIIKQVKEGSIGLQMNITLPGSNGVKSRDLVIFTRQLATMVDAGVPILRSLDILKLQSESLTLKEIIAHLASDVEGGMNLSNALAKHPKVFSNIYVNMVRAGETGGILDDVLKRLAYQQEKDSAIKSKIRSAMTYPAVIFFVTIIAFFILMTFIVPKIAGILNSLGPGKLPVTTKLLLDISHILRTPAFVISAIIILVILIVTFRRYVKTPNGRFKWHSLLLKIPIIKTLLIKTAIARFARIFASLMTAGVSITDSIDTTAGAIGNAVIEKELLDCAKAVRAGNQLSDQLKKSPHFPPIVAQMMAVGEETGKTEEIILKVADFYEEEVDAAVASLSSIIEPVMIVILGVMVGFVAISVYLPIIQISSTG